MLERLKSVLKTHVFPLLPPVTKAALFGILLFWLNETKSFWVLALFLFSAFFLYFRKLLEWRKFFYAFSVLLFYSLIVINFFASPFFAVSSSVLFAFLFFFLLGVKNFIFLNRETIFNFLYWILYFIASIVFFAGDKSGSLDLLGYSLLTFVVYYLLFKESLDFIYQTVPFRRRQLLGVSAAFLAVEAAQVIRWLPIGFLNSAVIATLLIIVLEDLISYHLIGALNRKTIIKNAVILSAMVVLIFLAYSLQV